jgi:tetratricopeptide (TPR) repeat protein
MNWSFQKTPLWNLQRLLVHLLERRRFMVDKLHSFKPMLLIIFIPLLLSCASTQQKQVESKDAKFYNNRGVAYFAKGEYDQAISELNKAIEINPSYVEAYDNRGCAYVAKGKYDQGISDFNRALEINPKLASAYTNRGTAYMNKGQYDQAISDINKALDLNPKFALAYYSRGMSYYYKKEYDKSWEDIKKAKDLGWRIPPEFLDKLRKDSGREN